MGALTVTILLLKGITNFLDGVCYRLFTQLFCYNRRSKIWPEVSGYATWIFSLGGLYEKESICVLGSCYYDSYFGT